ncbi:TonB-dependent receptor plug domain-containing protein [Cryomorpha ignava]|uniref:TonB-dependent receptor plug domain-containing protein n=1 Tax=Cryomorpha ignava TaxID=101383 RepID=A0A7K3WJZ6_9FLAO|nr:TonB-dependent receptor [Cryomorpha ignava]NEN21949.1 TonB-dependent receptor plug domain-containing protein [Cryomorpha ignava]
MKTILTTLIFLLGIFAVKAQNYGEIHGRILDHATGEPILFATVSTEYGGKLIGTTTDDEGRFKLKPLQPGTYAVQVSYLGYNPRNIENIEVTSGKIYFLGSVNISTNNELVEFEVVGHKLIDVDEPNTLVIKAAELKHNAMIKSPAKLIGSITPELKTDENGQFIVRGSRAGTSATYVDGMRLTGGLGNFPGSSIKSISVYTGGIPAKYGDITGGVVVIETKSYFDYFYDQNSR